MKAPKKIHRPVPFLLSAEWADGSGATIELKAFRNNCPCADCSEKEKEKETQLGFISLDSIKPGKYEIKSLNAVGNYAFTVSWMDGHDTGIYPYDLVRTIFEENALSDDKINELIENRKKTIKN